MGSGGREAKRKGPSSLHRRYQNTSIYVSGAWSESGSWGEERIVWCRGEIRPQRLLRRQRSSRLGGFIGRH